MPRSQEPFGIGLTNIVNRQALPRLLGREPLQGLVPEATDKHALVISAKLTRFAKVADSEQQAATHT